MHHPEQNMDISVLNNALWDIGEVHCGICEIGLLQRRDFVEEFLVN